MTPAPFLGWLGILRLGLVQTALGAIVVLTTSTINRVMVVELALAAVIPGALVGVHHAVQMARPRFGHGSDLGGRRITWIMSGLAVLAAGSVGAAASTALLGDALWLGLAVAVPSFLAIGLGVGAAGTALLALLAARVAPERRAPAATLVWIMMIAGFAVTTKATGALLDPWSPARLVTIATVVGGAALLIAGLALRGLDVPSAARPPVVPMPFGAALRTIWGEAEARRFTVFVFVSMLAYGLQDLILEPFAGEIFGLSVGESTDLASWQHRGMLIGMVLVALTGGRVWSLRGWACGGCAAAAIGFALLAAGALSDAKVPLPAAWFAVGAAMGAFAAAAIASMMQLAGRGAPGREGVRMGLWGAAQAIAVAVGNFAGTVALDLARWAFGAPAAAYATVFALEAALFLAAAALALRVTGTGRIEATTRAAAPIAPPARMEFGR